MNTKVIIDEEGAKVYRNGVLIKSGPLHQIRDWLDHKDNAKHFKRRRRNWLCRLLHL